MSAVTRSRPTPADAAPSPIHAIERLTAHGSFVFLLVLSAFVVAPLLLFGWLDVIVLATTIIAEGPTEFALMTALVGAGTAGIVGLLAAGTHTGATAQGTIEATFVCLALGTGAALVMAGFGAWLSLAAFTGEGNAVAGAVLIAAHLTFIAAGIGAAQRVKRVYFEARGRPFDTLPVVLLIVAIGLALSAALGGAWLAG
jgi:hypothetical protein